MAVLHPLKLIIDNYPEGQVEQLDAQNHPLKPELGSRKVPFTRELYIEADDFRKEGNKKFKRLSLEKEVRLRYGYIIKAESCEEDENGNVTCVHCTYIPESLGQDVEGHKPKGVIHWVSATEGKTAEIRLYERLFKIPNPGAADDFLSTINENSLRIIENAWIEPALQDAAVSEAFQFERTGYFCADSKYTTSEKKVFNLTVALKEDSQKAAA